MTITEFRKAKYFCGMEIYLKFTNMEKAILCSVKYVHFSDEYFGIYPKNSFLHNGQIFEAYENITVNYKYCFFKNTENL